MPIYDYKCIECGKITEFLLTDSVSQSIRCPECGNQNMEKLISAASYIVKNDRSSHRATCCGRQERCNTPPCGSGNTYLRG